MFNLLSLPVTFAGPALLPLHIALMNAWYFDYQGTEIRVNADGSISYDISLPGSETGRINLLK